MSSPVPKSLRPQTQSNLVQNPVGLVFYLELDRLAGLSQGVVGVAVVGALVSSDHILYPHDQGEGSGVLIISPGTDQDPVTAGHCVSQLAVSEESKVRGWPAINLNYQTLSTLTQVP